MCPEFWLFQGLLKRLVYHTNSKCQQDSTYSRWLGAAETKKELDDLKELQGSCSTSDQTLDEARVSVFLGWGEGAVSSIKPH